MPPMLAAAALPPPCRHADFADAPPARDDRFSRGVMPRLLSPAAAADAAAAARHADALPPPCHRRRCFALSRIACRQFFAFAMPLPTPMLARWRHAEPCRRHALPPFSPPRRRLRWLMLPLLSADAAAALFHG